MDKTKINDKIRKATIKCIDKRKWLTSTLSINPLDTIYQPIKPSKHIKKKIKYKLINFINPTLKEKYNKGIKNPNPINLPRNLCIHSHQKIILNSCKVIEKFWSLNSGISLYKLK